MTHKLPDDAMQIRLHMADLGWHSHDCLSDMGWGDKFGYSIWFKRYDWHGHEIGIEACIHGYMSDLSEIDITTKQVAQKALDAWDKFPTCIPHQYADGSIIPSTTQPDWAIVPPEYKGGVS